MLNITERTYYRWIGLNKAHGTFEDRRAYADHSSPVNKLSAEERARLLAISYLENHKPIPIDPEVDSQIRKEISEMLPETGKVYGE